MENKKSVLLYSDEHKKCINYALNRQSIIKKIELKAGEQYICNKVENSAIVFLISGKVELSMSFSIKQVVNSGMAYFIPAGESYWSKTLDESIIFYCLFDFDVPLCSKFLISQLIKYKKVRPKDSRKSKLCTLPINEVILSEIKSASQTIESGLECIHYQKIKRDILFMQLRGFYSKEVLADFFAPILGIDYDFRSKVMNLYDQVENVSELMNKLNMSPTTFKRKFTESFNTSAGQWLVEKKKERIFRDIIFTNISIAELADKYKFSENYMTTFCHKHFGKTIRDLRAEWKSCCK